ncbi:FAD-dependent oxidoreductase [Mycetocola tolaasinivorans]|uniref:FAD-dependent oxidoreductase n=1 Tax=Mycetocola tolaasinivorans TaxID=76635 RepID=UPI001FE41AAA|nr:FAD-binding protein [Mycetocola tolaasinivorans]
MHENSAEDAPQNALGRRSFLLASVGAAAAGALAVGATAQPAAATPPIVQGIRSRGVVIRPGDSRYSDLRTGNNVRFTADPEYVRLIASAEDARRAVQTAVDAGKRVSIRSGGHCFVDFVCHPDVEVILDLSTMVGVDYDERMRAFVVEPGARLLHVYEQLAKRWGVTIPGGICYSVGAGGHIVGGGYGLLSRAHGLVVDHLYAIEVVTVDVRGRASLRVATRDSRGALRDLWWAHTGGGGGSFGVVTKYWFRSPDATGSKPENQLVRAPARVLVNALSFPWESMDERAFRRILDNWGAWHEEFGGPGTPETALSSLFNLNHAAHGSIGMFTQIDADAPDATGVLERFIARITDGVNVETRAMTAPSGELPAMPGFHTTRELSWLQATRTVGADNPVITDPNSRGAHKSAYFKKRFTEAQVGVLWRQMRDPGFTNPDTMLVIFSFGGAVNAVKRSATANVQRDSIFKICLQTFWSDAKDDAHHLAWVRETYEAMFAHSGGVPVPDDRVDGCYINYPDSDIADVRHNRSGMHWSELYFQGNYPRLQRAKKTWDPWNFFTHSLAIELP